MSRSVTRVCYCCHEPFDWARSRNAETETGAGTGTEARAVCLDCFRQARDAIETDSLQSQETQLRGLVDAISEYAIFMLDPDGHVVSWNTGAERIKGYAETEILGEHFSAFYSDADVEEGIPERNLATATDTGQCEDEGWRVRKDGSQFWADVVITAVRDTDGTLAGFAKVTRDLTERKEYERQLEQYRTAVATATDAIVTIDPRSVIQSVNPAVSEIFGYEPDELLGESLTTLMPDRLTRSHSEGLRRYLQMGERHLDWDYVEITGQHADGREIPLAVSFSEYTYDGERRFVGIIRDNTAQKEHEQELKRYETLLEESTDVNALVDPDGTLRYVTPSVEGVLGYNPGELRGENAFEYIHPDDREEAMANYRRMTDRSDEQLTAEFRFRHNDGSWRILEAHGRNLLDEPLIEGIAVYTRDVTARHEYEQRLTQQRERLAALNQLNQLVQDITYAIVGSSSQNELEQLVCDRLVGADSYRFAWIGNREDDAEELSIRTTAGIEGVLNESYLPIHDSGTDQSMATDASRSGETQVVQRIDENALYEIGDEEDGKYHYRSAAAIPISYDTTQYGVLSIYSERQDAFEEEEREVITQLGEVIGYALTAIERKKGLMSTRVVELEFRSSVLAERYEDILTETDGTITIDRTIPLEDATLQYCTCTGIDAATFEAGFERDPTVTDVRRLTQSDTETRFEIRTTEQTVAEVFAAHGGRLTAIQFGTEGCHLNVEVAENTDVRQFVGAVQSVYPELELVSKKTEARRDETVSELRAALDERLTDRQRTVLDTAFQAGFFEWPRASTGEEIAESLGIAPATFHEHLRTAQRKLLLMLIS